MSEHQYKEFSYAFTSKGLAARFAIDKTPEEMYWNLLGLEVRQENALSSRLGRIPITATGSTPNPLPETNVHTLSRLKGTSGNAWRYAGAGFNIYRRTGNTPGPYSPVTLGSMSGNRFSSATYRPSFSSFPYIFFADSKSMLKDNGSFSPLQQWGIFPPVIPPTAKVTGTLLSVVDAAGNNPTPVSTRTYSNISPNLSAPIASISRAGGIVTVTTSTPHGIPATTPPYPFVGSQVIISGVTGGLVSFNGTFALRQVVDANNFTYQQLSGPNEFGNPGTGTFTSFQNYYRVNTTVSAAITGNQINTVTPASMANIIVGALLVVNDLSNGFETVLVLSVTATTFTAFFKISHSSGVTLSDINLDGSITPSTIGSITGQGPFNLSTNFTGSSVQITDTSLITFLYNLSTVVDVSSLKLLFDVGDGSFANDYYSATVNLTGVTDNTWTQFSLARGLFLKNGNAGTPGKTWANVNAYRVVITTNAGGSVIFQMDSLFVFVAGGPSVGPGIPYDYRYTYFNSVTGNESNPSVLMVPAAFVSPQNQSVLVTVTPSPDPQVTNINVYRRGGSLSSGWLFVAQIPANATSYVDSALDADILSNNPLSLDNDVPLTTTLPIPVNTILGQSVLAGVSQSMTPVSMANIFPNQQLTIDTGSAQEIVIVQSTTFSSFTAFFQNAHPATAIVAASTRSGHAVNLATVAFNQAWLAGDADNPNRLYYSKINNPEACPPQNWIEIGTPADPIMAVVFYNSQLFVLTQSRIYRVIIPFPGAVPNPFPTASRHGLFANFAFCISESEIPYLSKDGCYLFQGNNSFYATDVIEWLLADKEPNLGPVPEQDPARAVNSIMGYTKNEFFISYLDKNSIQRRLVFDVLKKRWRNDDVPATAMFYEEDTTEFVIGRSNGMIYLDRRGDVDGEASSNSPININLQTSAKDQGFPLNDKNYNELSLDVDTGNQPLSVSLLFDNGKTPVSIGTVQTNGRQRVPFPVKGGIGQLSQNVSLLVTGQATVPVHFFNWYIKAAVEAEFRDSFDSYWAKLGTDEYKVCKQGWFEYVAPDPGGIFFSVYIEGNMNAPMYTFALPQTTVRTAKRIRFLAVKAKIWRFVGFSASQFQLYGESFIEFKPVTLNKGYAKQNLGSMITAQGSV
jgi:hypothetical protein